MIAKCVESQHVQVGTYKTGDKCKGFPKKRPVGAGRRQRKNTEMEKLHSGVRYKAMDSIVGRCLCSSTV